MDGAAWRTMAKENLPIASILHHQSLLPASLAQITVDRERNLRPIRTTQRKLRAGNQAVNQPLFR